MSAQEQALFNTFLKTTSQEAEMLPFWQLIRLTKDQCSDAELIQTMSLDIQDLAEVELSEE